MKTRGKDIGKYILSSTAISRERISVITQPRTFSESDLSSLSERANIIKSQGALPILQINHRGVNYFIQQIYSPFSNERNDEWEAVIIKEWISHYK